MTSEIGTDLTRKLVQLSVDEHKELLERWKAVETKAQGNVSIAGIFVAGAFGFIRELKNAGPLERSALGLTILLLVISVIAAVLALRVTHMVFTPAPLLARTIRAVLAAPAEELADRNALLAYDEAERWQATVTAFRKDYVKKAQMLFFSQMALTAGIVVAALLTAAKALVP